MIRRRAIYTRVQDRVLLGGLYLLALASFVATVFGLPTKWQTPMILVALILIITLLSPVQEIRSDVHYLRYTRPTSARTFEKLQSFYDELSQTVSLATTKVDLTHIRDNPPDDFGMQAGEYMKALEEWVASDDSHSARRIISVTNPRMMEWAKQLKNIQDRIPGYHVRVVDWSIPAPALNMAIIDDRAVFLALTGAIVERTSGFAVEDSTTASYFSEYYEVLWNAGTDLDEYLTKQLSG